MESNLDMFSADARQGCNHYWPLLGRLNRRYVLSKLHRLGNPPCNTGAISKWILSLECIVDVFDCLFLRPMSTGQKPRLRDIVE
jgi:hypothetical protein